MARRGEAVGSVAGLRTWGETVARPHRDPIGQGVGNAEDQDDACCETRADNAGDDGKGGDDTVVRAVGQIRQVPRRARSGLVGGRQR